MNAVLEQNFRKCETLAAKTASSCLFLCRDQSRCTTNHRLNLEVLMFVEKRWVSRSA